MVTAFAHGVMGHWIDPSWWSHYGKVAVSIKLSNLLICFCSFDLSYPVLEKDDFIKNVYIVLSCLIK